MYEPVVEIYVHGNCSSKGVGAWVALFRQHPRMKISWISDVAEDTDRERMELLSAVIALERLDEPTTVNIYTTCPSLRVGIRKRPIRSPEHADLWARLDKAQAPHSIIWDWLACTAHNRFNADVVEMVGVLIRRNRHRVKARQAVA